MKTLGIHFVQKLLNTDTLEYDFCIKSVKTLQTSKIFNDKFYFDNSNDFVRSGVTFYKWPISPFGVKLLKHSTAPCYIMDTSSMTKSPLAFT